MGVANWDLTRKHQKYGCKICEHNPMGVCEMCGREVPMNFVIQNGFPKWCPKPKKGR